MPLRGRDRTELAGLGLVLGALGLVLVVGLVTLAPSRQQGVALLETKTMSDQAWQEHLLRVRERQRQFEKEDTALMKSLDSRDHSVRAMLNGDHFSHSQSASPAVAPSASAQQQQQQEFAFGPSAAEVRRAKEEKARASKASKAEAELAKVQKRRAELLRVAVTQLTADKEKVVADVVGGGGGGGGGDGQALAEARRRLIGDERLVALLEASELAGEGGEAGRETAAGATAAAGAAAGEGAQKGGTPMIVRGHRHVADVLADNDAALRKAGVRTEKDFAPWLMGMHSAREARARTRHEEDGTHRLLRAGVAVDRLPGLGEDWRKAIPLPAFHDGLGWEQIVKGLDGGHRPISPGYEKMHRAGVNVNAPNLFVYGSEEHGTPRSDRSTTPFHYADGLEDAVQDASAARQHKPLSFVLHDLHRGSERMEHKGINVWGANVLKGLMHPAGVPASWENRVPAERLHHPLVDGRDGDEDAEDADPSRYISR